MHCDAQSQLQANNSEALIPPSQLHCRHWLFLFFVSTGHNEIIFKAQILNIILLIHCIFMYVGF